MFGKLRTAMKLNEFATKRAADETRPSGYVQQGHNIEAAPYDVGGAKPDVGTPTNAAKAPEAGPRHEAPKAPKGGLLGKLGRLFRDDRLEHRDVAGEHGRRRKDVQGEVSLGTRATAAAANVAVAASVLTGGAVGASIFNSVGSEPVGQSSDHVSTATLDGRSTELKGTSDGTAPESPMSIDWLMDANTPSLLIAPESPAQAEDKSHKHASAEQKETAKPEKGTLKTVPAPKAAEPAPAPAEAAAPAPAEAAAPPAVVIAEPVPVAFVEPAAAATTPAPAVQPAARVAPWATNPTPQAQAPAQAAHQPAPWQAATPAPAQAAAQPAPAQVAAPAPSAPAASTPAQVPATNAVAPVAPAGTSDKAAAIVASAIGQAEAGVIQDCTALVENALRAAGVDAGDLAPAGFFQFGTTVDASQAKPGDLVYYADGGMGTEHVAVYIGDGKAVHGGWNGNQTVIDSVNVGSGPVYIRVN